MTRRWLRISAAVLAIYWGLIFLLTHIRLPHPLPIGPDDKLSHFLAFFGLAVLLRITLTLRGQPTADWPILLIAMLYAAADEQTQKLVGRSCELQDWYADTAGAAVGVVLAGLLTPLLGGQPAADRRSEAEKSPTPIDRVA